jgi:hypothetical protein
VVITAAATFWCTRRLRTGAIKKSHVTPATAPVTAQIYSTPAPSNTVTTSTDDCSYLCTACGTEKYSADQMTTTQASKSSPYKMVILVRTDLNMVPTKTYLM